MKVSLENSICYFCAGEFDCQSFHFDLCIHTVLVQWIQNFCLSESWLFNGNKTISISGLSPCWKSYFVINSDLISSFKISIPFYTFLKNSKIYNLLVFALKEIAYTPKKKQMCWFYLFISNVKMKSDRCWPSGFHHEIFVQKVFTFLGEIVWRVAFFDLPIKRVTVRKIPKTMVQKEQLEIDNHVSAYLRVWLHSRKSESKISI